MAKGRFPMGGFPGGGNMNNMIKQAQKMQENLVKAQQEIEEASYDISAGGGAVNLTINGNNQITKISINPEVVDPDDVEMLEDLIMSAFNEAIKKVEKEKSEKLGKLTGGMGNFGGLF
ncbi:MAG: YbaB/EbfC family nucleoid-associated protein [Clostridia bacterium]|nr:YbaB/EbfC family nucleoid-associated protein [Oscillospiraceae bacterium]MBR4893371.1 YbaB/EbfC family nucleoid-associated protein [Clostridia bacterium]